MQISNANFPSDQVPPPYNSPVPTLGTSWAFEMIHLAEKMNEDMTYTLKSRQKTRLNKHSVSQGLKLVSIAVDEYEQGNETVALDIYLTGVDKIIMALPNKADTNTQKAIRVKLESVEERIGIHNSVIEQRRNKDINEHNLPLLSKITCTLSSMIPNFTSEQDPMISFKELGQYITDWSVALAVSIKQSPLPGIITFLFSFVVHFSLWFDAHYGISQKIQTLGVQLIKLGLKADQHYRLHEFISEGFCILVTAGLRAVVAFKEAPLE